MNAEYEQCGSKKRQSPINLLEIELKEFQSEYNISNWDNIKGDLHYHYNHNSIKLNIPSELQSRYQDYGGFSFDHFHFHSPSEHTIDSKQYDLEMHMVLTNKDNTELRVYGILFEEWDHVIQSFPGLDYITMEHKIEIDEFDLHNFKYLFNSGWNYNGSLTSPPCSEKVEWVVSGSILKIDSATLENIRNVIPYPSNRPVIH